MIDFDLEKVIDEELLTYQKIVKEELKESAKATSKDLRQTAPKAKSYKIKDGRKAGTYARHWRWKTESKTLLNPSYRVYVSSPEYPLTHLLEYGHWNHLTGKFTPPIPHIAPAEDRAEKELTKNIVKRIKNGK